MHRSFELSLVLSGATGLTWINVTRLQIIDRKSGAVTDAVLSVDVDEDKDDVNGKETPLTPLKISDCSRSLTVASRSAPAGLFNVNATEAKTLIEVTGLHTRHARILRAGTAPESTKSQRRAAAITAPGNEAGGVG